ncbi:MAG: hypothetical protein M0R33_09825 [Methylomonas sp.]|jgi:hypothetical protein|uniref:hypothetical protein n=1 Tax=Methylomonas sp. TaxID=418 RepID=UPI0025D2DFFE|nr:hypothetical protein [Methylomonas sp.]MCK9606729.1 hypothetical protein [Methylomonas sp.]
MPLDAKGRTKRAKKAASVAAKNRKAKTLERDKNIYLAYHYLSGGWLKKSDSIKAITFLTDVCGGPNLKNQESALRKLADGTKLSRQRIHQIVNKAQKLT